MTTEECETYIQQLHWDTPEPLRNEVKEKLKQMSENQMQMLIFPHGKGYWDGAAEVITAIGLPRVQNIMPGVMEWLQDMNWPGSQIIYDFLCHQKKETILPHINKALHTASQQNDEMWLYWMMQLMEEMQIKAEDFTDPETQTIFKRAEDYYHKE